MTTTRRRTTTTMAASAALVLLLQLQDAGSFLLPTAPTMERSSRCSGSSHGWMATAHTAGPVTRLYHSPKTSAAPTTVTGPQTDDSVPEGHKGLHTFLYGEGEGGAEGAHATAASSGSSGYVQFTRGTIHEVQEWLAKHDGAEGQPKVAGVYGVYDDFGGLRYIGSSRDVGLALRAHVKVQGRKAAAGVAVQSFRFPKREEMANYQAMWLAELAQAPEGNDEAGGSGGWAASIKEAVQAGAADDARRAAYEATKGKLRKAMADPTLQDELDDLAESSEDDEDAEESAEARREALRRAMGGSGEDDWSAVVDAQTKETLATATTTAATATTAGATPSPFRAGGQGSSGAASPLPAGDGKLELTPANVDKVLEEVRPYLIADGGNIEVVKVETEGRNIQLRLQGACGSCPSSTVTMKMGVERVLREKFADLGLIEAIAPEPTVPTGADGMPLSEQEALKSTIEAKLGEILPAIRGLGAAASVQGVDAAGVVTLSFQGPDKVRLGVVYALKGLPGVADVKTL